MHIPGCRRSIYGNDRPTTSPQVSQFWDKESHPPRVWWREVGAHLGQRTGKKSISLTYQRML